MNFLFLELFCRGGFFLCVTSYLWVFPVHVHGPFLFVGTSRLWVLPVRGPFSVGSSYLCYFLSMGPSTLWVFPICEYFLYMALSLC